MHKVDNGYNLHFPTLRFTDSFFILLRCIQRKAKKCRANLRNKCQWSLIGFSYIYSYFFKVAIFQECQPEFLHDLVLKMRASIFTPGDVICRKGEVAREMFIIADGVLEVIK